MKESHVKGLATHSDPESCGVSRKGDVEALTGERTGWVYSRVSLRDADDVGEYGRLHPVHRYREVQRDPARSQTPCTYGNTSQGNREIPRPRAAVHRRCWRTFIFITCSTSGPKRGVRSELVAT
jgi:hypothetical protein